jgi:hypothetical protein
VRIGFYYRWAVDIDFQSFRIIIVHIPVARYLCRGIHRAKQKHKTFSLLPDTLIPYNRISIDLMMYILQLLLTQECARRTLEIIDSLTPEDIFFSEKMIEHLLQIMELTRIKLILFYQQHNDTDRAPPDFHAYTVNETIKYLLGYPTPDYEHPVRGAYHLSVLYYKLQGSYHRNARFLFGTASQFCR